MSYSVKVEEGLKEPMKDPRREIKELIKKGDLLNLLYKAAELHGHFCIGLSLGVLASYTAIKKLSLIEESGELRQHARQNVIAIVENNLCFADGVQMILGTTLGNDSLILRDVGKSAVTLVDKRSMRAVRVALVKDTSSFLKTADDPKFKSYFERVMIKREKLSDEEYEEFRSMMDRASVELLAVKPEEIFKIEERVLSKPIETAQVPRRWFRCDGCGELTMEAKVNNVSGKFLCPDCAGLAVDTLSGRAFIKTKISDYF